MQDMSTETLARALGEVVRDFDRQIDRHLEGVRLQVSAMIAEGQAKVAEMEARRDALLNDLTAKVMARLAELKDGQNGADGKDGIDGAPGKDGDQGPQGEPGKDGDPGRDGIDGAPGKDGEQGPQGEPGRDGKDGVDGRDGVDGKDGKDGADGRDGIDGKSVSVRGTFDPEAEYVELDIVALNGGSFIALKDAPGPCPGGGWQLLASRGSRGEKGDRGERGMPGEKGDRGERGVAGDTPAALYVDGRDIVLTMASGAELRTTLPMVQK